MGIPPIARINVEFRLNSIHLSSLNLIAQQIIKFLLFFVTVLFLWNFLAGKLGTHGSPRRRNAGHDPPVKQLGLGEVKRFIEGMHNTETLPGEL